MNDELVTPGEAQQRLGVSVDTIRQWRHRGLLTAAEVYRVGRRPFYKYRLSDIQQLLGANREPATTNV